MDLKWWASKTGFQANCSAPLREQSPTLHIWSDASLLGAGAHSSRGEKFQREWSEAESLKLRSAKEAVLKYATQGTSFGYI